MPIKTQYPRTFNKNLFYSRSHLYGLTLGALGERLDPPVSRFRVWQIIHYGTPDARLKEIATILKTKVNILFPKITEEIEDGERQASA